MSREPCRAVLAALETLTQQLKGVQRQRLERLLELLREQPEPPMSRVLDRLFPGVDTDKALSSFRGFLLKLRAANERASTGLDIDSGNKKAAPEQRALVIRVLDHLDRHLAEFNQGTIASLPLVLVPQQARVLGEPVHYLVIESEQDQTLANDLCRRLDTQLSIAKDHRFTRWRQLQLLLGEERDREFERNLDRAAFCLVLHSPRCVAKFRDRLPEWVQRKPLLPAALESVDPGLQETGLTPGTRIFQLNGSAYRDTTKKTAFAEALAREILQHLTKRPASVPEPRTWRSRLGPEAALEVYIPGKARTAWKASRREEPGEPETDDAKVIAEDYLLQWLAEPDAPPYLALLGEYGMGKTTLCQQLTRRLSEGREAGDRTLPEVAYFDCSASRSRPWSGANGTRAASRPWTSMTSWCRAGWSATTPSTSCARSTSAG